MFRSPTGVISEDEARVLFDRVGFQPPSGMPTQDALMLLMQIAQEQAAAESAKRPRRGRTAVYPKEGSTAEAAEEVLRTHGATCTPIHPCGVQVHGIDIAASDGTLTPEVSGALEVLMAAHGLVLMRGQGKVHEESGVKGRFLSGEQQCRLSECFGAGALHSTHGVHPEAPNRDVFRLSNDPDRGFNSVGPEWHNDGSFCREVFGHVVYHIVKAPHGAGDTRFAHLGRAVDRVPPKVLARLRRCVSVNSNGGAVHPLVHKHPISGRESFYLHLGMTGAIIEVPEGGTSSAPAASDAAQTSLLCTAETPAGLPRAKGPDAERLGIGHTVAWREKDMDAFFSALSDLLDHPDVCYSHKWEEGDVVIIDNLAVAHKAAPGAHDLKSGLRILHRTTILSERPHDPPAELRIPHTLPTDEDCPFEPGAVWEEGYVGFRWGAWTERATPH